MLQQAIVDVQRVSGPQAQVQLQHDGLGVLGVQQPGTSQLHCGPPLRPEKVRGSKRAIKVHQVFATGGVGAVQLVSAVWTVPDPVAVQGGWQAAGGLGLGARHRGDGAESEMRLGGRRRAAAFIGGIATFILTVALPRAWKTLPIPT